MYRVCRWNEYIASCGRLNLPAAQLLIEDLELEKGRATKSEMLMGVTPTKVGEIRASSI